MRKNVLYAIIGLIFVVVIIGVVVGTQINMTDNNTTNNTTNITLNNTTDTNNTTDDNSSDTSSQEVSQSSNEKSSSSDSDVVSVSDKENYQAGDGSHYKQVEYADGNMRQYDYDGNLIGSTYESDQKQLGNEHGELE